MKGRRDDTLQRERSREMMGDCVRRRRLCAGATDSFIAPWCNNQRGKVAGLCRHCKKVQ
jgi:hypothetical protein